MSGIIGACYLDGRPVEQQLAQMVDTLAHRGPDGADIWIDGSVGLGHRMLWTTPESLIEKLPLVNRAGDIVITSDCRIDNREELIAALQLNDRSCEQVTDSELILRAYEKWDEECAEHLLGDFAFAIWDKRKQRLFCARDHMGVKPFYYYHQPGKLFAFGSEIKALLCLEEVPRRLNEVRIADYLNLMLEDKVITSYQDILRLPPAHSMVVNLQEIQTKCYWSLDPNRGIKLDSDAAYAEEFRRIFTEAVRCRLRSAFPIASQLSGGLDSSAVTCVARDILTTKDINQTKLHTISTIFDKIIQCDERPFINAVLEQGGLIPHYIHGDEVGPLSSLEEVFKYEDEGFLGPSHFYPWISNRAANKLGMRIVLDGLDGDTTVCHGTSRITELARQGDWKTCINEVKAFSPHFDVSPYAAFQNYALPYLKEFATNFRWFGFFQGVQLIHKHFGTSRKNLILNHGIKPSLKQIQQFWQRKNQKLTNTSVSHNPLVKSSFAKHISLDERIQRLDVSNDQPLTTREQHWLSLTQGVLSYVLERSDYCAANFCLEVRHPFMDKRLIEFCLALPAEQKLSNGFGRMVMRRALDGILPEKVQWRGGKADLSPNFDDGFLNRDRALLDEVMSNQIKHLEKYIDSDFLQAAYQRMRSDKEVRDEDITPAWQAVMLALWFDSKKVTP
ncbi:lasso peptide isopeptide bond-forming cyclase [Rivularia sp. UHCC 0363]|uniref:lasso peptide isopeptide bond-forming cyclase n=1 Tax=Rivularia sp. UHCC 0363 TaxID=3110244 RepID=UPI002B2165AC|nr:lasso peptide isopeptide bond-forming cyclase [Rivularia sp. UHCC 0363]MEA5598338.1 lasso peptide isopeptide bond-forming cyclase [Rivularia sp. UHCC 0363]